MKNSLLFCAAVLAATILCACSDANQVSSNDRIHGAVGVGVASENTSRIVPERPYTAAPSGPVLTPSSSPY